MSRFGYIFLDKADPDVTSQALQLDSIGDFAVGLNAGQVRAGDHNRLLAIEEELGLTAVWVGKAAHKGRRQ